MALPPATLAEQMIGLASLSPAWDQVQTTALGLANALRSKGPGIPTNSLSHSRIWSLSHEIAFQMTSIQPLGKPTFLLRSPSSLLRRLNLLAAISPLIPRLLPPLKSCEWQRM